ncbi:hypothetical protein E2C01_065226 [Portunus trituberculatus]|uniref:Uncharacterized protein n=1 Tax=Portunus trituberculatus TaxID=210409 RepID=A0A5B7HF24_PORTR|nr:hypothetical protein [Portunus trituberculatus]
MPPPKKNEAHAIYSKKKVAHSLNFNWIGTYTILGDIVTTEMGGWSVKHELLAVNGDVVPP